MGENYINFWRDKKNNRIFTTESEIAYKKEEAIEDFRQHYNPNREHWASYAYTLKWHDKGNAFEILNFEEEVINRERQEEKEADAAYVADLREQAYEMWRRV